MVNFMSFIAEDWLAATPRLGDIKRDGDHLTLKFTEIGSSHEDLNAGIYMF